MSKTLGPKTDFRIRVEPRGLGDFGSVRCSPSLLYGRGAEAQKRMERDMEDRCDEIVKEIKRHVGDVSGVYVEFDQHPVCEHCGWAWTEKSDDYNGGCCEKDEQAEIDRKATE